MRRLTWIAVAVFALTGAGAAAAWFGALLKTESAQAEFTAARTSVRERSCVGSDGHTYRQADAVLVGTMTSGDSRLSGRALFRLRLREDVTAGLGTTEGRVWVFDGDYRKVSARIVAVNTNGNGTLNGLMDGRVFRASWLVANFSATWDGTTLHGYLGQDSLAPTNSAVIQSRGDIRCSRPGKDDQEKGAGTASARLEVRKSLSPADDAGRFDLRIDDKTYAFAAANNGTTGERFLASGKHEVSEAGAAGAKLESYTTSISCRDGNGSGTEIAKGGTDGDLDVTVAPGADVVCVITNTRNAQAAGKLEVRKEIEPSSDTGRFNLFVKQGSTVIDSESSAGDGESTGEKTVSAGTYEVSETAAGDAKLDNYTTSISCRDGNGSGTEIAKGGADHDLDVTVAPGADVVCVITNKRKG